MTASTPPRINLILRIQWIALFAYAAASLLHRKATLGHVPDGDYLVASLLGRSFMALWLGWLLWFTFGPGKARPFVQRWLFLDPMLQWVQQIPLVATIWLTWPGADDIDLLLLFIAHLTATAGLALGSARLPPSRGFGSPVALVMPVAMIGFFLSHDRPFSLMAVAWIVIITVAFLFARALLERLLNNEHDALTAARTALAAVSAERAAKEQFLVSVSHDLAQPLQATRLFVDTLLRQPEGAARDRAARSLRWALDTTEQQLHQMIEHLQLDSGQVAPHRAEITLGTVIARIVELHEPAAQLAGGTLRAVPSALVLITDATLLQRALGNLVANAIRHAGARRILFGARRRGTRVRLWVIDDGIGIAPAEEAHLFDDFVQGDHGDQIRGGFGLGLASARRTARLLGGDAGHDARWTGGSAFWLELPLR